MSAYRKWLPTGACLQRGVVRMWTWTRRSGLRVTYTHGLTVKSEWTLPEFLQALKEGREGPATEIEVPL